MSFSVRLSTKAYLDAKEIVEWYNNEKTGLGADFYTHLTKKINSIKKHPFFYPEIFNDVRQTSLDKYPYHIHFIVNELENEITIYGITHTRRNPEIWKSKI